jgi:hypothetical protein
MRRVRLRRGVLILLEITRTSSKKTMGMRKMWMRRWNRRLKDITTI